MVDNIKTDKKTMKKLNIFFKRFELTKSAYDFEVLPNIIILPTIKIGWLKDEDVLIYWLDICFLKYEIGIMYRKNEHDTRIKQKAFRRL